MLIEDGVNGILVPQEDCEALANAMRRLLRDEKICQRLGRNAKALREKVDVNAIAEQWLNHMQGIRKVRKDTHK